MKIKDTVHFQWYKSFFVGFVIFICFIGSSILTEASLTEVIQNLGNAGEFLKELIKPDFSYLPKIIGPMIKTLKMSVLGTVVGVAFAIPVSFLATTIFTKNELITQFFRLILNIIRTIPNLLLAALLVAIIGIGDATGVVTIAVFTFGVVSQLIFETIETIDLMPIESAEAVGARKLQVAVWAIWPQIMLNVLSYFFYAFEINVRASVVLGYVGAGGIGVTLSNALGLFRYDRASLIILAIFIVVMAIDKLSEAIRGRLE